MARYLPEIDLGRSTGGSVSAGRFGSLAYAAGADESELRGLLARARTLGYGPAPCADAEIPDIDVELAIDGFKSAAEGRGY